MFEPDSGLVFRFVRRIQAPTLAVKPLTGSKRNRLLEYTMLPWTCSSAAGSKVLMPTRPVGHVASGGTAKAPSVGGLSARMSGDASGFKSWPGYM